MEVLRARPEFELERVLSVQGLELDSFGVEAAKEIQVSLERGGKAICVGCGGSAAMAQHFTAEMVGRFKKAREPLPAISLTADTAVLTAIANDFGVHEIFVRQLRALSRPGDVLVALTTSGKSESVIRCIQLATELSPPMPVLLLTGVGGTSLSQLTTCSLVVRECQVSTIQEAHLVAIHRLMIRLEELLEGV